MNEINNLQDFENNYELRKALNKLENELQKKEYELNAITNLYQEIKNLNERLKKENNDLTNKLNSVRNEMNIMEKKYQNDIDTIKSEYTKKIDVYENKILKLSEYNPNSLRKNIEIEMQNKFKQQLILKDKEIEELSQELNKSKQANELLETEYETYKSDIMDEINTQKQMHKNEINILLEKRKIEESSLDDQVQGQDLDNIKQLKKELDTLRSHINELNNEIDKLRHDKEILTIEKNDYKLNLIKIRDSQNFNQKKLESELNRAQNTIENSNNEINILNNTLKNKNFEISSLLKENEDLKERINNYDLEFIDTKNQLHNVKNMVLNQVEINNNNSSVRNKESNEMLMKERKEKEEYQKQINELNIKLKEAKSDDLIQKEKEIEKLKDELRLCKKEIQYDSSGKSYKELLQQYKLMTEKKNEYKTKCRIANENIEQMINLLDEQQQIEFSKIVEKNKNKYLKKN